MSQGLEKRLRALEERVERTERLAYATYCEVRRVAEYAYQNVLLEVDAEEVKRMPGMRGLSDQEAMAHGLTLEDVVTLKFKAKFLSARCRRDALSIGRYIAEERKRDPVDQGERKESAA